MIELNIPEFSFTLSHVVYATVEDNTTDVAIINYDCRKLLNELF